MARSAVEPLSGQSFVFENRASPSHPFRVVLPSLEGMPDEKLISTKIWRSSLLMSAYILGLPVHSTPPDEESGIEAALFRPVGENLAVGKDVLEVGCGRALPGILASQCSARRVALTDCDHRCLDLLAPCLRAQAVHGCREVGVYYQLWEEDQKLLEELTEEGFGGSTRHWSSRFQGGSPRLPDCDQFDLILCSDCLYFAPQVVALAAVLQRRLRAGGLAIVTVPARRGTGIAALLAPALAAAGFAVHCDSGPFDWEGCAARHVEGWEPAGEYTSTTRSETGAFCIVLVKWLARPAAAE